MTEVQTTLATLVDINIVVNEINQAPRFVDMANPYKVVYDQENNFGVYAKDDDFPYQALKFSTDGSFAALGLIFNYTSGVVTWDKPPLSALKTKIFQVTLFVEEQSKPFEKTETLMQFVVVARADEALPEPSPMYIPLSKSSHLLIND
jgi:hypothetical protein